MKASKITKIAGVTLAGFVVASVAADKVNLGPVLSQVAGFAGALAGTMFHTLVLIGAAVEVVFLRRPFIALLVVPMFALFLAANLVRWWVIRTLGEHWNVQVVDSTKLGFVTSGPFRYVRHPNYAAVFVEMIALPLIHTA